MLTWLEIPILLVAFIATIIGACFLQHNLIPVVYRALISWPVFPFYRNRTIQRTKLKDVYRYMQLHDIPIVNFRETHGIGDSLLESMSRKSSSASFRSYEERMHRFERQVREEVARNDMLCRRSGYVRQSQNRMIMNDMTRIRCTDQLTTEIEGATQSSSELVSQTITQQISLRDFRLLEGTQPADTEMIESTQNVTEPLEVTQSFSLKNSMLAPPIPNGNQPPRFSAPTGMPDLSMPPPMQQNPSTSGGGSSTSSMQASRDYMQSNNYFMRPAYRFKVPMNSRQEESFSDGPGRRLRKNVSNVRRHIDYASPLLNHLQNRLWIKDRFDRPRTQPDTLFQCKVLPPSAMRDNAVDCVMSRFVRAAMNKVKCPVYATCWTPEGKRLITGASSGEFTLWNGTAFNFETILQAHGSAVRAMQWSHNDQWMISADHEGYVKYWQPNMNNVHMFIAHKDEPIRSLSFAPTDSKLVTGSDDATAKIFDFGRCVEERVLRGHGSDVRSVAWHPRKGLIATGSRDSQQPVKLWDPRSGQCLSTLYGHKNSVMSVEWNKNGNWLLSGSRDHLLKLYDIRMMKEMRTFRAHKKEVTALAWHPVHENLFVSGGGDGSIAYWLASHEKELALLEDAHDQAIWSLKWHPLGHILASGSNDNNTKFWARNRPGDTQEDIFGIQPISTAMAHAAAQSSVVTTDENGITVIPGMGLTDEIYEELRQDNNSATVGFGGALLFPEEIGKNNTAIGAKRTLIKQPPAKKLQRQFERLWNPAKPGTGHGGGDAEDDVMDEGFRPKMSLLGRPTSSYQPLGPMWDLAGQSGPGGPPHGGPSLMGPPHGGPSLMGPPHGGSPHGGPSHGGPSHDGPSYGGPPHGGPLHGGPPHGGPPHGGPPHGGPPHGGPPHGRPPFRGPLHGGPSRGRPPLGGPHRGGPLHGGPPHGDPGGHLDMGGRDIDLRRGPYRGDIDMRGGGPPPPWAGEDRRGRKRGRGGRF